MSKRFDLGEMEYQIQSFNAVLQEEIQLADSLLRNITHFMIDDSLQGNAYNSLKQRMGVVHGGIWKGLKTASQSMMEANNTLLSRYRHQVGDAYLNEDIIIDTIHSLRNYRDWLMEMPLLTSELDPILWQLQENITILEGKIDDFNSYDMITQNLYDEANGYLHHVRNTLAQLEYDDFNMQTKTFTKNINMDWTAEMNRKLIGKELAQFMKQSSLSNDDLSCLVDIAVENPDLEIPETLQDKLAEYLSRLLDDTPLEIIGKILEASGGTIARLGGLINYFTGIKGGNFVILNTNVLKITDKFPIIGKAAVGFGKVGIPIFGGILDFVGQVQSGEDTRDAVVKATVHTGVEVMLGETGAAIGSIIGSFFSPGLGTVVGAAVAGMVGTFVGYYISDIFDGWYDSHKEKIWGGINSVGEAITNKLQAFGNDIGRAVGSISGNLGSVFE